MVGNTADLASLSLRRRIDLLKRTGGEAYITSGGTFFVSETHLFHSSAVEDIVKRTGGEAYITSGGTFFANKTHLFY